MQKEGVKAVEEKVASKPANAAAKPKSGRRKWLGRIGNFLMMGGWILVAIVAIGIVILVSILTK